MATIKIFNLQNANSEFLTNEESFLKELVNEQKSLIYGGGGYSDVPFCPVGTKPIKPHSPPICIYRKPD